MSYTMTIDEPGKAAWFEEQRATMPTGQSVSPQEKARSASIVESLVGVAKNFETEDDHGILARAALEKIPRIREIRR